MRLIERAFQKAYDCLREDWNEVEGPGSNPRITEAYSCVDGFGNPEMMDDSKFAWCSCFVNYCIQKSGGKGTRSAAARSWLRWGKESDGKVGDIVVFRRGNSPWQGHVGFVLEKGLLYISVLGGNQSDQVKISKFPRAAVLGYRTSLD